MTEQEQALLVVNSTNEDSHHHRDLPKLPVEKRKATTLTPNQNLSSKHYLMVVTKFKSNCVNENKQPFVHHNRGIWSHSQLVHSQLNSFLLKLPWEQES